MSRWKSPRDGRIAGGFIGVERVASGPLQVLDDPRRVMHLGPVFVDDVRQFTGRRVVVQYRKVLCLKLVVYPSHGYVVGRLRDVGTYAGQPHAGM